MSNLLFGADLTLLDELATQLTQTGAELAGSGVDTATLVGELCAEFDSGMSSAVAKLSAALTRIQEGMRQADARTQAAFGQTWGNTPNGNAFNNGFADFNNTMTQVQTDIDTNFNQNFKSSLMNLQDQITAYAAEIQTALTNAQGSSDSMSSAVTAQRSNLDAAMNGLSFG